MTKLLSYLPSRASPLGVRYAAALLLVIVALGLRLAIAPLDSGLQYVTFFPAASLSAIFVGLGPGLFATGLGLILANYFFTAPYFSFFPEAMSIALWPNLIFLGDCLIVCFAVEAMHRYRNELAGELSASKNAHSALTQSTQHLKEILDNLFAYVALLDTNGRVLEINKSALERGGYRREDILGQYFYDAPWWSHDDQVKAQVIEVIAAARRGEVSRYDITANMSGELVPIDFQISPVFDEQRKVIRLLPTAVEITARKKAEEALRIAAATFETSEAVVVTDRHGTILRVNRAFEAATGYSADEVIGKNPRILNSGRHDRAYFQQMWEMMINSGSWEGEVWDRRKNGEIYPKWLRITALRNDAGEITEYVGLASDITERKKAEDEIYSLAFYDPLTKLPNRRLLFDRCESALSSSARSREYGALLLLDMDRFKVLNDTLGHNAGDQFLVEVANRIKHSVREIDTSARLGGDEFVVLVEELGADIDQASPRAAMIAEAIRSSLARPYAVNSHEYHSSPSIGVCLFRGREQPIDDLLKHADIALYQAKNAGRNTVRFYDPGLQEVIEARAALEADLRRAVQERQFELYFQVQLDKVQRPIGAEALIRWNHPTRGLLLPGSFMSVAEETTQILEIGRWVIEEACRQLAAWYEREATRHLHLAVNVSAHQFMTADFVSQVAIALERNAIAPKRLKLELTETVLLKDLAGVADKMRELRALGVLLSLDDFGTGYSSLSYLGALPIDQLKIDQSFVQNMAAGSNAGIMVKAIIDLGANFGLNVIAEGVETSEQLHLLQENGCLSYQGFLFGRPMRLADFERAVAAKVGRSQEMAIGANI